MKIETRFKTGDDVFVIDCIKGIWTISKYNTIQCIKISVGMYSVFINYFLIQTDTFANEEDCFATKEEAQKECDLRNGNKN